MSKDPVSKGYVLVVDDEPDIRNLVSEILVDEGYQVATAENAAAARAQRRVHRPDLVLLDIWMPDTDGIALLREWREEGDTLPFPVVMISGHGTIETAVEATRLGAWDFIEKPLSMGKLLLVVERALQSARDVRELQGLRERSAPLADPVGAGATMGALRERARRIAAHDSWVLIRGEAGAGKETFARYIHAHSRRREGPFVDVGVASIARQNAVVELFGREVGERIHYGRIEQANGGVLFLDEICDMDLATQAPLLGALETGSFLRVGGTVPVRVNVRVIAATQRDPEIEVRSGRLRQDLFYRLNVLPLDVPPLRAHREDVAELVGWYVDQVSRQEGLPHRRFTVAAQNVLRNHTWPGNVRELRNLVQRLLILGGGDEIDADELRQALGAAGGDPTELPVDFSLPLKEAREQFERIYLKRRFEEFGGSVSKLAEVAGMERTHIYRKLRALGIDLREKRS